MKSLAVVGLVLVASCASGPPKSFPLPDGRTGYTAFCNGNGFDLGDCYQVAATFCGGAYEIVGQEQNSTTRGAGGYIGTAISRNVYFTCEVAPPKPGS
jgi:hypothetical protein